MHCQVHLQLLPLRSTHKIMTVALHNARKSLLWGSDSTHNNIFMDPKCVISCTVNYAFIAICIMPSTKNFMPDNLSYSTYPESYFTYRITTISIHKQAGFPPVTDEVGYKCDIIKAKCIFSLTNYILLHAE